MHQGYQVSAALVRSQKFEVDERQIRSTVWLPLPDPSWMYGVEGKEKA